MMWGALFAIFAVFMVFAYYVIVITLFVVGALLFIFFALLFAVFWQIFGEDIILAGWATFLFGSMFLYAGFRVYGDFASSGISQQERQRLRRLLVFAVLLTMTGMLIGVAGWSDVLRTKLGYEVICDSQEG